MAQVLPMAQEETRVRRVLWKWRKLAKVKDKGPAGTGSKRAPVSLQPGKDYKRGELPAVLI